MDIVAQKKKNGKQYLPPHRKHKGGRGKAIPPDKGH